MKVVYERSKGMMNAPYSYCAGCLHALATKNITEALEEMNLIGNAVAISGVGCASGGMNIAKIDNISSLHGRAGAVATGFKRMNPNVLVLTTQGDGDCASIGIGETLYAANRGEAITVFMFNNSVYGMTGAQMAPTTMVGQATTTCVNGRDPETMGYPLKLAEMIATLEAPKLVARCAVNNPKNVMQFKKLVKQAFQIQMDQKGYSFIEVITGCPTGVRVPITEMSRFVDEKVLPVFPLGIYKNIVE